MSDLVTRLRRWTHAVDAVPASDLMDEAADEIDRLRPTEAEVNAIRLGELAYPGLRITDKGKWVDVWATLRGLLDRIGHQEGRDE